MWQVVPKQLQGSGQQDLAIEASVQRRADAYFVDAIYNENASSSEIATGSSNANRDR